MVNSRTTLITILLASAIMAVCGPVDGAEKPNVVISFSHTSPDTAYWRLYAEWLERRSFDGVAMAIDPRDAEWLEQRPFIHETIDPRDAEWYVDKSYWQGKIKWARSLGPEYEYLAQMYERPREKGSLRWGGAIGLASCWATGPWNPNNKWTDKTIAKALADLQATRSKRFKWNLISAGIMSPTTDWFNDQDWAQRCHNFAILARLARRAGLKGIMFDDEEYGEGCVFNYEILRRRNAVHGKNLAETQAKARQRGREFARAICKEFPDIVFWTLHGYGTPAHLIEYGLPKFGRRLEAPFFDGMLEGSSEQMVFVDGGELAYGYNTREQFEHGRKMILEEPIRMGLTKVPNLFRKKVRCGFGLWPDYYGKLKPGEPDKSYFSPGRFQRALYWALNVSDGYVWLYGQSWSWWLEGPDDRAPVDVSQGTHGLPLAYWKALEAGRTSPGRDTSPVRVMHTVGLPSQGRYSCIEGSRLAELLKKTEKVYELPVEGWTFKQDDWGGFRDDPKEFKPILIGEPWDQQGFDKTDDIGIGWYRLACTIPEEFNARELYLYFPKVDGSLWLGINGRMMSWRYVEHDRSSWLMPFALGSVREFMTEDGRLTFTIKVQGHNKAGGGILAQIQLLAR